MRIFHPVDVFRIPGTVRGTEGVELDEGDVPKAGELGQHAAGGVVEFFVATDQVAGQLHIVELQTAELADTADQQDLQAVSVKSEYRAVDRKVKFRRFFFHGFSL